MKKTFLLLKKYGWLLLIVAGAVVSFLLSRKPKTVPGQIPPPEPPKPRIAENFIKMAQNRKEQIDEEIKNLSRKQLIDSINSDYE